MEKIFYKYLSRLILVFVLIFLLAALEWVNNNVSYKYEVQQTLVQNGGNHDLLLKHQKDIIFKVLIWKYTFIISGTILFLLIILRTRRYLQSRTDNSSLQIKHFG